MGSDLSEGYDSETLMEGWSVHVILYTVCTVFGLSNGKWFLYTEDINEKTN